MTQKKAVALLELTGSFTAGNKVVSTLNYFWTLVPQFSTFEIINNNNDASYCLLKLQEYYDKGYRIFLGPITSTLIKQVIPWFNSHPDAVGITTISAASSIASLERLNYYRLLPSGYYFLDYMIENLPSETSRIFYIYNENQLTCIDLLNDMTSKGLDVVGFPVNASGTNLTKENIADFFLTYGLSNNDIALQNLPNGDQRNTYFNFFTEDGITFNGNTHYDSYLSVLPKINDPNNPPINLQNKYYSIFIEQINTVSLLEKAKTDLGNNFSANTLTALYIITELIKNNTTNIEELSNTLYSYGEVVPWFNENKDIKYFGYSFYYYTNENKFVKKTIYLSDPNYGPITFNKKN